MNNLNLFNRKFKIGNFKMDLKYVCFKFCVNDYFKIIRLKTKFIVLNFRIKKRVLKNTLFVLYWISFYCL